MQVTTAGIVEIAEHEGIVPAPYLDSAGVWTWGVGHTAAAGDPDPAKMDRAMPQNVDAAVIAALRQFKLDLAIYADRVRQAIRVPLRPHEFDALVSFDFNTGGIFTARLTRAINAGERDAARHFMGWVRPPEIRTRRAAEMALFQTSNYRANGDLVPVWRTDGKGRLRGIIRRMHGADLIGWLDGTPLPPVTAPRL